MVSVNSVKSPVSLANSSHLISGCSHRTAAGPDGKHRSAVEDGVCGLCNSYTDFRSYKFAIKQDRFTSTYLDGTTNPDTPTPTRRHKHSDMRTRRKRGSHQKYTQLPTSV